MTNAIAAMRAADTEPAPTTTEAGALAALCQGLEDYFSGRGETFGSLHAARANIEAAQDGERERLHALRQRIADRIEADMAVLNSLDALPDLRADFGGTFAAWHRASFGGCA